MLPEISLITHIALRTSPELSISLQRLCPQLYFMQDRCAPSFKKMSPERNEDIWQSWRRRYAFHHSFPSSCSIVRGHRPRPRLGSATTTSEAYPTIPPRAHATWNLAAARCCMHPLEVVGLLKNWNYESQLFLAWVKRNWFLFTLAKSNCDSLLLFLSNHSFHLLTSLSKEGAMTKLQVVLARV